MKEEASFSRTQPLRLGFLFAGHEGSGGLTEGVARQPQVLSVTPEDLPVIIRLLLHEGPKDYILRKTKAGKLLLNRRDEIVRITHQYSCSQRTLPPHSGVEMRSQLRMKGRGWLFVFWDREYVLSETKANQLAVNNLRRECFSKSRGALSPHVS